MACSFRNQAAEEVSEQAWYRTRSSSSRAGRGTSLAWFDVSQQHDAPFDCASLPLRAKDRITQRRAKAIEQSCDFQEILHFGCFAAQNFLGQVFENVFLPARTCQFSGWRARRARPVAGQPPTLGGLVQACKCLGGQAQIHAGFEKSADFVRGKAQVGSADLSHLVEGAQAGEGK